MKADHFVGADQPQSLLTASAAVTAQSTQQTRLGGEATRLPAGDLGGERIDGNASGAVTRQSGKQNTGGQQNGNLFGKNANQPKADAQAAALNTGQTQQQAATAAAAQRSNLFAATLARSNASAGQQTMQPLNGDVGIGGPGGQNQTQPQRAAELPQTQRPKPQLPPRFVSDQVSVQIQRAVGQGADRINIQLKPAELGRVEVKLEVGHDGKVNATISAERQDTLDLLRQDARNLQQSLQQAGLNTDSSSLSFSLKQHDGGFEHALNQHNGSSNGGGSAETAEDQEPQQARHIITDDMVDVEV